MPGDTHPTSKFEPGSSRRPDLPLAVVIGAGGMSLVIARRLSQRHRVLVADLDGERAEAAADTLVREGGDAASIACDVTDPAAVGRLASKVKENGPFAVLAHVAGLSPSLADYTTIMRVNLLGPALVTDALLPLAGPGTAAIIIASLAAHNFRPDEAVESILREPELPDLAERVAAQLGPDKATPQLAYALSKFGVLALCRRKAAIWGKRGARIVSLSPGLIASPQGATEFARNPRKFGLLELTPLAREGTMLEIADAVEFLASDRASFISGTDLLVDGGLAGTLAS
jgi:NAD(P)-dependent dehydrogenase (short-subunit alcohol dehydrogenase family)